MTVVPNTTNATSSDIDVGGLVPRRRIFDEITNQLRELILNGDIAPGTKLRQEEVAERLGVSRTPLREAFRVLERDGLVRVSNGNKTVEVVQLSLQDAIRIYEIREVLDGLAARLAAFRGLDPQMTLRLSRDLEAMAAATRPMSLADYGTAHADFHLGILEASGNATLVRSSVLVQASWQMVFSRRMLSQPEVEEALLNDALLAGIDQHRGIFEAIVAGSSEEAERLARAHVRHTMKALSRAL